MKTKEAIEFMTLGLQYTESINEKNTINKIIELLQRGGEYERILKHIGVISDNEQVNRIIRDTLLGG